LFSLLSRVVAAGFVLALVRVDDRIAKSLAQSLTAFCGMHVISQGAAECQEQLKVRLCVAVAVEHPPKYQHKRLFELGR